MRESNIRNLYRNFEEGYQRVLPPGGIDSVFPASSGWFPNPTWGSYYYIIHKDTLAKIPIEAFDQVRGVKKYFLKTREDYEAIHFTLVWP